MAGTQEQSVRSLDRAREAYERGSRASGGTGQGLRRWLFSFRRQQRHLPLVLGVVTGALTAVVPGQEPSRPGYALAFDRARQQAVWVTNFGGFAPTNEI